MENWHLLDSYEVLKTLENQEPANAVTKAAKCQNYLNETNKFTMLNHQVWEIRREIDCHTINVIYYLKCKMCNEKETNIGKTKGDDTKGFKVRINQHISDCKTGDSTCKVPGSCLRLWN